VRDALQLDNTSRALDLGCGPGTIAIPLSRLVGHVLAIDPSEAMLNQGQIRGAKASRDNIEWLRARAEDVSEALGTFNVVTMGQSFHWMDRAATLEMLDRIVTPDGGVALFHDAHPPVEENGWFKILCDVQNKYRQGRRGGHRRYEPFLFASAFSQLDGLSVTIRQELTAEDILGRAFSMSTCSREKLGAAGEEFAMHLSSALREWAPDGKFTEVAELVAVLARRPKT